MSYLLKHRSLLLLFMGAVAAFGQTGIGRITGVITDPSGSAIANAEVQARNSQTEEVRRATTNSNGFYVVSPLPAGIYTLQVRRDGFKAVTRSRIQINVNSAPAIDLRLEIGAVTESVRVSGTAPVINTENSAVGNSRFATQLENLPLIVREVSSVVGQTAGVPYGTQSTVGGTYEAGGRSAMGVVSDGALVNPQQSESWPSIGGIGRRADLTIPGVNSISEVQFVTNGSDAQYGQPVQVLISSKSGTNEVHGSAFEFYTSGGLGARRWEAANRESFIRHQFGGTLGGPIKKDKMFFTAGLDGFRYSLNSVLNGRYPTADERTGDLSDLLQRTTASGAPAPVHLYDPLSKGQVFPNNVIPSSRIDPIAAWLFSLIPEAPLPAGRVTDFNAIYSKPEFDNSDKYDFRFDYNLNDQNRLFARTTVAGLNQAVAYSGSVPGFYGYSGKHERTEAAVANWTRTVNPTTLMGFEFTFRSMPFKADPSPEGDNLFPISIQNIDPKPPFAGPPAIAIGSNGLSMSNLFDRKLFNYSADYGYTFEPTVSKVVGNHVLKAGFDFSRGYKTNEVASPPYGRFQTKSDYNNASSTTSATGDAFADYLLGLPSSTDVTIGPAGGFLSKTNFDFYLQDDWKVNSRLTLNLGIRYDSLGFFEEMNKRASAVDFATGKIVIPNQSQSLIQPAFLPFQDQFMTSAEAGVPNTLVKPNRLDFVPRFGAAYRLTPTFAIRGGFGIYSVDVTLNQFTGMINTPPFVNRAQLTRSLLISQGVDVNSLYTFENPTANGNSAGANSQIAGISGPLNTYPTQKNYQWNFTLEKSLGSDIEIRASYLGNLGRNLTRGVKVNACVAGPTECLSRSANDPTSRRWIQYGINADNGSADGQSEFNSVEIEFQKRFSHGFLFDTNYSYARLFAYADASDPVSNPLSKYDWGPVAANMLGGSAASGQPNNVFHWNWVYELPIGKGHALGDSMGKVGQTLLGGWMISGLGTWQSGDYLTITTGTGQSPTGATSNRPNQVARAALPAGQQSAYQWFNTSAFVQPDLVDPKAPHPTYQFGNSPIGAIRGPSFFAFDATLQKAVSIGERSRIQFRLEVFNPFNHPVLGDPITDLSDSNFGRIQTSNANYNPRRMQLGLKFEF
ncbi:MAG TPA: TonB-dependent receptor [Bryobacteraceae bacterium]|nr:TonB-dependent receptor [Bryobacteraceae bacterium]